MKKPKPLHILEDWHDSINLILKKGLLNMFSLGMAGHLLNCLMTGEAGAGKKDVAVIETSLGNIEIEFMEDVAPGHVDNFKKLAKEGFYNGTIFHRVIPGFMIQGGDPNTKSDDRSSHGTGGPGYSIKAEFSDFPHERGILSMARSQEPDSAGSQFFIVMKESSFLDNNYTVFGKVLSGMDVADKIVNSPRDAADNPLDRIEMTSVKIESR
jgi:peptidyl-prolyl cis-trans isomerase B (cyclophilin B)